MLQLGKPRNRECTGGMLQSIRGVEERRGAEGRDEGDVRGAACDISTQ